LWSLGVAASGIGAIPGEVKLWPGSAVPDVAKWGLWVWADGTAYSATTYPLASANIATAWKTAQGKPDPGAGMFRVPDLRGLVPAGMDAMPGGTAGDSGRIARTTTQGAIAGEELHTLTVAELAAHGHGVNNASHSHGVNDGGHSHSVQPVVYATGGAVGGTKIAWTDQANGPIGIDTPITSSVSGTGISIAAGGAGISIANSGSGTAHENLQPTVWVPYIVKLDDV